MSAENAPENAQQASSPVKSGIEPTNDHAAEPMVTDTEVTGTAQPAPMEVDETTPAADPEAVSTPAKAPHDSPLGNIIASATPTKRGEPQFKCVYPPSEDTQSLVVEHFGFLPISFIDEIINAANDTIYRATDALCKFVEKEQGSGEATSQAINKAETLLEHAVDKNFDKFELYALRNLFNVPQGLEDYVVMPHRSADATGGPVIYAEDEAALDKELEEVRQQLIASNLLKTRVQCDIAKVERGLRRLRALNEHLHISEITQQTIKDTAVIADVRARIAEITQLVEQLEAVAGPEHAPASMEALKEPSGRDLYLAHMSDIQKTIWERRQAQPQVN